jgi:hypothetical protein
MADDKGKKNELDKDTNSTNDSTKVAGKDPSPTPSKRKKNLFLQIVKYAFLSVAFLILTILILLQTTFFKTWILDIVLTNLNESAVKPGNKIFAESLSGNLITGIKLKNAGIIVQKDTLVKLDNIDVGYNIFKLLDKEIYVNNLVLENPQINFTHVWDPELEDGKAWNFTQIFKSTPDTIIDTTISEFDWGITVDNLELRNADFRSVDSAGIPIRELAIQNLDTFNFGYLDVTDLNIKLSGKYFPEYKEANIERLGFNTNSEFDLKELVFKATLNNKTGSRVENFSLVTNRTDVKIPELFVSEFTPFKEFDYEAFGDKNVKLIFLADKFDFADLSFFLPSLDFMQGRVFLDLEADDKYKNLAIKKLLLKTDNSTYNFTGRVENLQKPEDMIFNITGSDMIIDPVDTERILPGLDIPDYSYLGIVNIPYITYKGTYTRFDSDFDVRSSAGNANGTVFLDLENQIRYRGNVQVQNVNIGKIVKDQSLESDINGEVIADGSGFEYGTMNTRVNYDIRNTRFFDQNITSSAGQINANGGNVQLDVSYISNVVNAKVQGTANIRGDIMNMTYNLKGTSQNLDISGFTKDNAQKSNLNFTFDINGRGLNPDNITGDFDFNIANSQFAEFIIPQTPLNATIQRNGDEKLIDVKSNFLDFNATGVFDITGIAGLVSENLEQVINIYSERLDAIADTSSLDTLTLPLTSDELNISSEEYSVSIGSSAGTDMRYTINIKDLVPLSDLVGDDLRIKGRITGSIRNQDNIFTLIAEANDSLDFAYGDSTLIFKDSDLSIKISNNYTMPGLSGYSADLRFISDTLIIAKQKYDSLDINLQAQDINNRFKLYAELDTNLLVYTSANLNIYPGVLQFASDTTRFKYNAFDVTNRDTVIINYIKTTDDQLLDFRQFTLQKDNQRVSADGIFSFNHESDLTLEGNNIKISSIELFQNPETRQVEEFTGGIRRAVVNFTGTLDSPRVVAEVNSDPLYINQIPLGRFDAELLYNDNIIEPDISFYNANNKGNLKVYGIYPIPQSLGDTVIGEDTISIIDTLDQREVDLTVDANNFQLDLLSRYIPNFSRVSGGLDGEVKITGIVSEPDLAGSLEVKEARFVFDMTKMYYGLNMNFTANNEKFDISGFRLFDPKEPDKFISGSGSLDLSNLRLSDINLTLDGSVRAFDSDNGPTSFGIYGDLIVGSGTPKLTVTGNQDRILIKGNLLLVEGNVTLNPLGAKTSYNLYEDEGFVYTVEIDSSTIDNRMIREIKTHIEDLNSKNEANVNPFQRYFLPVDTNAVKDSTKSEVLNYELTVRNQNDIYLRFIVNEQTRQEFFGNVDVDLRVNNLRGGNINAYGEVTLGNNAYYQFYRRFIAEGEVTFQGPITEPILNVSAEFNTTSGGGTADQRQYRVVLTVTGTAKDPKLDFQVFVDGAPAGGTDPTSAAISVILFGKLNPGNDALSSVGGNIGSLVVSDYLSSAIQDILPFIVNTSVNYVDSENGSLVQNTDLTFTAQFGDATVRFGGQVFNDINNTNIVVEYPLNKLLGLNLPSNLVLQVERVADPFSSFSTDPSNSEVRTGALIYYKIKF